MAATLKLEIVTPEGRTLAEDVEFVTVPAMEGEMGVFPGHVPLLTQIAPGEAVARIRGRDQFFAVGDGFVEITPDHVSILTDMAISAENIDEAKAEEARQRAESRLAEQLSAEETAVVRAALAHSLAQLRVKRQRRQPGTSA